jgi:amino-acid N-acetyltransferase
LISQQASGGHILPRALSEIYGQIRDFWICEDDTSGEILGCGALHFVWENLGELRSLAVREDAQRKGIGSRLAEAILNDAREMGVEQVFVLTYRQSLFERLGFTLMDKRDLPHKIWADCIKCTKFPDCDEMALVKRC